MANKPSGLGRGLGDLLDDNNPSLHTKPTVVLRGTENQEKQMPQTTVKRGLPLYDTTPKPLFESKPRNKRF